MYISIVCTLYILPIDLCITPHLCSGPLPKSENPPEEEKTATGSGEEKSTEESESDYQPFNWDNNT